MSQSRVAVITFLDGQPVDPGFGQNQPVYPSQGPIYGGGYPSHQPIPPGSIGTLPVFPFDPTRPDQGLPPSPDQGLPGGSGGNVDNTLPGGQGGRPSHPINLHPGMKLVVKYLACHGFIAVPDQGLPETPEPK